MSTARDSSEPDGDGPDLPPDLAAARRLYERFLPPEPFRSIDPALYEMRFTTGPAETLAAWEAAERWSHQERDAAYAMHFAEAHLRTLAPGAMVLYDRERGAGTPPADAIDAARSELQAQVLEALHEELGIEAGELGLDGRARDDWVERQADDLTDPGTALPATGRAAVALAEQYRSIAPSGDGQPDGLARHRQPGPAQAVAEDTLHPAVRVMSPAEAAAYLADHPDLARRIKERGRELAGQYEGRLAVARSDVAPADASQPGDLVDRPAPVNEELGAYLAAGNHAALCQFAEVLGHRRDELFVSARELVVQEQEVAALVAGPEAQAHPGVPPAAVAACLASLVAETGDDVATVGIALGVDPDWVRGVLLGEVSQIDAAHVESMCAALESTPEELFGLGAGALGAGVPALPTELAPPPAKTAAEVLVDTAGFLRADELLAEVAAMKPDELDDLCRALTDRHSQLQRWAEQLAMRVELAAARLQVPSPIDEDLAVDLTTGTLSLPAAAAAAQIEIITLDSGDDLDTVARALGLESSWVREVVDGTIDVIDADHGRRLCDALELSPASVFGIAGVALEGPDSPWVVVPYDPFDHEPHLELLDEPPQALDLDFGP